MLLWVRSIWSLKKGFEHFNGLCGVLLVVIGQNCIHRCFNIIHIHEVYNRHCLHNFKNHMTPQFFQSSSNALALLFTLYKSSSIRTFWDLSGPFRTVRDRSGPCMTLQDCSEPAQCLPMASSIYQHSSRLIKTHLKYQHIPLVSPEKFLNWLFIMFNIDHFIIFYFFQVQTLIASNCC